jgi:hypothetical protein
MAMLPEWMTLTCGTCGKDRQVKYRKYGVKRNQNCHSCAGKQNDVAKWATTHGGTGTSLYWMWCGMKNRCYTKNSPAYARYGARGIEVCDEWLEFAPFREWSVANGYKEGGMELHRRNGNGNYYPQNCEWLTKEEHKRRPTSGATFNIIDVAVIKRLLHDGFRPFEIAKDYKVNPCLVSAIKTGYTWAWVETA